MSYQAILKAAICALLTVVVSPQSPCHGDVLLEFKETVESTRLSSGKRSSRERLRQVWIGDGVARLDTEMASSWILDLRKGHLLIVTHFDKGYHEVSVPLVLESLAGDEGAFAYEMLTGMLHPKMTLKSQGQTEMVGDWHTDFYHWSITMSRYKMDFKEWMATDLDVDEKLYDSLLSSCFALSMLESQWIERVLEPKGVAVRTELTTEDGWFLKRKVNQLESIEKVEPGEDTYRPPPGYVEKPFDFSRYFKISQGEPIEKLRQEPMPPPP